MSTDFDGSNLVFIACQPRSGSTLLQRMLGGHPAVHTVSEPWVMLPPAYTLKDSGIDAEYDAHLAHTGVRTFWENLPEGRDDYIEGMRRMYGFLYQRALDKTEATLFLDKTPRYYLILQELKEVFPQARFILLVRNPLAVLSSILRTWIDEQWLKLWKYRVDLLKGPQLLLEAISEFGQEGEVVYYEELVQSPQPVVATLCDHLNIETSPKMVEYGDGSPEKWRFGDPESVYKHSEPKTSSLEKWAHPENAQQWRLLRDYSDELGEGTFKALGYEFEEVIPKLGASRPRDSRLRYTVSLNWILRQDTESQSRLRRHAVQLLSSIREEGGRGVVQYLSKRLRDRFG